MSQEMDDRHSNIVKLRGLPWNSTAKDVIDFLKDCHVQDGEKGVHLSISHRDGRPNGEAFVELTSPQDVEKAFEYNKNVLGHRYIEVFNAKPEEFEMCLKRQNLVQQDTFIKLRGLPFSCKNDDIEQFFQGLEIRNGTNGIFIVESRGRPTGEAFIQFCSSEDTDLAMKKNREKIGSRRFDNAKVNHNLRTEAFPLTAFWFKKFRPRSPGTRRKEYCAIQAYIEIFRSSSSECRRSTIFNNNGRAGFNGGGNGSMGGGMNNFNNDRMGRGQRNNRTNFRDRPYPDTPWNQGSNDNSQWRNNNSNGRNFGNFSGNNFNNDNFSDNFSSDFERNWNSGGGNPYNSFGGGNLNQKNSNSLPFDREFGGFNQNSNSGSNNFGNDRFVNNGNNGAGGCQTYAVHLRGLPYNCGETEVEEFFAPLKLVNCQVLYNNNGRHTGEADAYFESFVDAQEAMKKHKEKMGSRYIELFAKSNERRGGGNNGGGRF